MNINNILSTYNNKNKNQASYDSLTSFLGYNQNIYADYGISGAGFVFVTKPCLFIYPYKPSVSDSQMNLAYNNMCKDPYFSMFIANECFNDEDLEIVKQLSYKTDLANSLFLPLFTNNSKQLSTNDSVIDTANYFSTREGYNVPMPLTKTNSEASSTTALSVTETGNLDFTKTLGLWTNYIINISNGTFNANPVMIKNNMLDYTCSIYYFSLGPDGRTIKYWCRYTSCFPTTVPYSSQSYQRGNQDKIDFDIGFQYTLKEEMNPRILEDFNIVSLKLVNATYTNQTTYDEMLRNTEHDQSLGYVAYSKSSLLNKEELDSQYNILSNADRDPVIYYEKVSNSVMTDEPLGHYVLSFGDDSIENKQLDSILETTDFSYKEMKNK